jgi:hypothetical protein
MGAELGVTIATTLDATTILPKPTFRSFGVIEHLPCLPRATWVFNSPETPSPEAQRPILHLHESKKMRHSPFLSFRVLFVSFYPNRFEALKK